MAKQKPSLQNKLNQSESKRTLDAHDQVLFSRRVFIVLFSIITGLLGLLSRAFYLQVKRYDYYSTKSENNRVKFQVVPPVRGNIFDRNKVALSENILTYDLVVNRSKSKNLDDLIAKVKNYMRFDAEDIKRYQNEVKKQSYYGNVVVRGDLSEDEINHFLVDLFLFPGFEVIPSYKRYYPYGHLTAHIVGYINDINKKDLESLDAKQYAGTQKIGRTGIEKSYESELHGKAGYRQAEMSSTGKVIRVLESVDPIPGKDLYLSLDLRLQKIIIEVLEAKGFEGSAVALDPNNGEVLAMVSNPSFDSNLFVNGISHKDYNKLRNSTGKNLFNRALNGRYPPASTIKPMMSLAALHHYVATPDLQIECNGSYRIPDYENTKRFFCWKRRGGHGEMTTKQSIVQSCDVYYYNIGKELGIDRIGNYLAQFSLGEPTGIDLPNESAGILPSKSWKKKRYNKSWFIGDTINTSIGQGYMLTTPLQMANFTAILASGGKRYIPHLVKAYTSPSSGRTYQIKYEALENVEQNNPNAWSVVREALVDVMYSKTGTGRKVKINLPFKIAGKTGTAQVFSFKNEKRIKKDDLEKHLRDNAAFITYAPANQPKIALSVMIENGGGGSETAAPIATEILERYFKVAV